MNRRNMMKGMSSLMVLTSFAMIASVVAAQEGDVETAAAHWDAQKLGAGLALGLCGIGTGMSQGPIGAAAHDIFTCMVSGSTEAIPTNHFGRNSPRV